MNDIADAISSLEVRLKRIEELLTSSVRDSSFQKEFFTVPEACKILGKKPFTIREWCRLHRIQASKRKCGRGRTSEWIISSAEIERYLNEGLLPQES